MVDLHVLSSLDQLLFISKISLFFFTKIVNLMRSSTVLSLPTQLVFPVLAYQSVSLSRVSSEPCSQLSNFLLKKSYPGRRWDHFRR